MKSIASCSAILIAALSTTVNAQPLPFNDGTYVRHAELCLIDGEQRALAYTDRIGALVREINGSRLSNAYEMSCEVSNVKVDGSAVTFRGDCESEGEPSVVEGSYTMVSANAFRVYGETYRRCGSDAAISTYEDGFDEDTSELIKLWHEANGQCRGGPGNEPETWGACGAREAYGEIIQERGWCYGETMEFEYQKFWAPCLKTLGF